MWRAPWRTARAIMLTITGIIAGFVASAVLLVGTSHQPAAAGQHAPTVQQVRELATLLTSRIEVADVSITRIDGYLGSVEAALLVRGQVDLGVDLERAALTNVDEAGRIATLSLPHPAVVSATLDHRQTRIVALTYRGVWLLNPQTAPATVVIERALASTQETLAAVGQDPTQQASARQQAERVVAAWAAAIDWKVGINWF